MNIADLQPKKVFEFFSEIAAIPHGSGNTEALAEYCLDFARGRGLDAYKDNGGNVMIFKNGTDGYENSESIILQGHLDMVCEKDENCTVDMEKEGLRLCTDGKTVWADGTTLGGDDGIALAYILTILDSDNIPHPPIEALFTRDEETGMNGAFGLEASRLRSKRMINIDSEDEGIMTVGCAGGVRAYSTLPISFISASPHLCAYEIDINGLVGGHSGIDINKNRQNAIKLLGRLLDLCDNEIEIQIVHVEGGGKTNVIPNRAKAVICTDNANTFKDFISRTSQTLKSKLKQNESDLSISIKSLDLPEKHLDKESSQRVIRFLSNAPNGVQSMNSSIPELVQTSLNLGTVAMDETTMKADFLIRSNRESEKSGIAEKVVSFVKQLGGKTLLDSDYPSWEYRENSPLRDIMVASFEELYRKQPHITTIHAGLECGIFAGKLGDVDIVSIGPDLRNIHTPQEYMDIASVERTWKYLLKILENLK